VKLYRHKVGDAPVIMGHENIGVIAKGGPRVHAAQGLQGRRLWFFVEHYVNVRQVRVVPPGQ